VFRANHSHMVMGFSFLYFLVQEHGLDHYPIKGEDNCEDEKCRRK